VHSLEIVIYVVMKMHGKHSIKYCFEVLNLYDSCVIWNTAAASPSETSVTKPTASCFENPKTVSRLRIYDCASVRSTQATVTWKKSQPLEATRRNVFYLSWQTRFVCVFYQHSLFTATRRLVSKISFYIGPVAQIRPLQTARGGRPQTYKIRCRFFRNVFYSSDIRQSFESMP
jgi:hypothetical protein